MKILGDRACGSVKPGGYYASMEMSEFGNLHPITGIFAQIRAEIPNPRLQKIVNIPMTLKARFGLWELPGTSVWGLPVWGIADQWGEEYYPTPWHIIDEIQRIGVNRRVAPSLVKKILTTQALPLPMLIMHRQGCVKKMDNPPQRSMFYETSEYRPWLGDAYPEDAEIWCGMGHIDYPDNLDHVNTHILKDWFDSGNKVFPQKMGFTTLPGIIGLSPITSFYYVLKGGEDDVPSQMRDIGVQPALAQADPRADYV